MEARPQSRDCVGDRVNIREAADGWYVDLPGDEVAGPFDDEYEAVMAERRIAEQVVATSFNDGGDL